MPQDVDAPGADLEVVPAEEEKLVFRVKLSRQEDFLISAEVLEEQESNEPQIKELSFATLSHNWTQLCLGLFEAFPVYGMFAELFHVQSAEASLAKFLDKVSFSYDDVSLPESGLSSRTYSVGTQYAHRVFSEIMTLNQYKRAETAHLRAQLLALVAEYEAFVCDLLRLAIEARPEHFIPSDSTVPASEIINGTDLPSLKAVIIEDRIEQIQRQSHVDQVCLIFDRLKIARPDEKTIQEFAEICERRNMLTHANGRANRSYFSKLRKLGVPEDRIDPVGTELTIDFHYMRRSIARVFQMGYFTLHIVWQHLRPDERDLSTKILINDSHEFLKAGYTKVAQRICNFILNKKSSASELDRAYAIINLALSSYLNEQIPLAERQRQVEDALKLRNWDIVDSKFALALVCLREQYQDLAKSIDACVRDGLDLDSFLTWSLFTKARERDEFKAKMMEHFGIELESFSHQRRSIQVSKLVQKSGGAEAD